MKEKSPWHRPLIIVITILFVLGIIALVTTAVVQNKLLQKYKYGIVLDAGSSHTAVYVYEWPAEKENNTGMVEQKHVCSVKGKGISSYSAQRGEGRNVPEGMHGGGQGGDSHLEASGDPRLPGGHCWDEVTEEGEQDVV
ncbi:hypothetical protein SKAU_G00140320 [Synaphobranchus kaupii]|uniref:Ectonucleoside triphosphate diphosphohydrolase 1 n=1 Tax=Synaphobranchus kaupii TaxID=118154 RepID=A0A9Q1FS48_SYNKA|nr:hypothetical protein SKAU_G00140320 [Synaphobranchus kaupii]